MISRFCSTIRPMAWRRGAGPIITARTKFTASTFAVPKDDFAITKLVHGKTALHIGITERARDKLWTISQQDNNPQTALKISVESGGCHGFQYNLDLSEMDKELGANGELLVFRRQDGDKSAAVMLDEASLEILQDSKIDYAKELIGSQFKVVDLPYTSTECGCGASFDFDFDKLEQKKEKERQATEGHAEPA